MKDVWQIFHGKVLMVSALWVQQRKKKLQSLKFEGHIRRHFLKQLFQPSISSFYTAFRKIYCLFLLQNSIRDLKLQTLQLFEKMQYFEVL